MHTKAVASPQNYISATKSNKKKNMTFPQEVDQLNLTNHSTTSTPTVQCNHRIGFHGSRRIPSMSA